ncbi:DUF2336 domain-containing protein [Arenibaculum pallidiluteum]|uniref:DUF2336 domain-containing protein n=1 Tax=Arenibaculum pallidiluteum TaxID=2812559 RepID=UPI001A977B0B|nr:DUF2336 domain-containing protein [Arenibaculum pallidiluteum]
MTEHLSKHDVERLLKDPSPQTRAELAAKVAGQLELSEMSASERDLAQSIVRLMARDAALRVREALADNLKSSTALPRDVALLLARDVESVALPILEASLVLTETDLVDLVRSGNISKQTAIARRHEVPAAVADALIDHGAEGAVAALVANEGAEIGERSLVKVIDRFGASPSVQEPLVHRRKLPVTVSERLVALVSDRLRDYLVTHHELPATMASDLVLKSRERATATLFAGDAEDGDVERLVAQLHANGRLTPSLMLRALCMGDVAFIEASLSLLARVPLSNARLLIHDAGTLGMKSIYDKAGLPPGLLPAIRVALNVARETDFDGEPGDLERHRRRMIERILTQYEDMGSEDLDYLLDKLSDMIRPAA